MSRLAILVLAGCHGAPVYLDDTNDAAEDARRHLELPIEERLRVTLALGSALIEAFPQHVQAPRDDDAATWRRVRARLGLR